MEIGEYQLKASGSYEFDQVTYSHSFADTDFLLETASETKLEIRYVSPIINDSTLYPLTVLSIENNGELNGALLSSGEARLVQGEIIKVKGKYKIVGQIEYEINHTYIENSWPIDTFLTAIGPCEISKKD